MSEVDFRMLANDSIRDLTPYKPGKPIEELERELGITSSIKLASNENALGASPLVNTIIQASIEKLHYYPDSNCFELKQALSEFLNVDPHQLTIGNGSENILELIIKSYLRPGDNAVFPQFTFITIPLLLEGYGINCKVVPTQMWQADVEALIQAIDAQTRVLFLVNPNNPTGTYINQADFELLMKNVPADVLVVMDEAYYEYAHPADYPQTLPMLNQYPNLIICRTFSKAYGLPALRIGYAISSEGIADILNRARLPFNVNALAQLGARVALNDQAHVKHTIDMNRYGMQQITSRLKELSIHYIPSFANFVCINVGDGAALYQQLLQEGVIVRPLANYNMATHIRVTIGTPMENERFLTTLEKWYVPLKDALAQEG